VRGDNSLPLHFHCAISLLTCRCLSPLHPRCLTQRRAAKSNATTQQATRNRDFPNPRQSDIRHGGPVLKAGFEQQPPKSGANVRTAGTCKRTHRTPPSFGHAEAPKAMPGALPKNHTHEPRRADALAASPRSSSGLPKVPSMNQNMTSDHGIESTHRIPINETSPTPHPISRTRIPAGIPAPRKRCSVKGSKWRLAEPTAAAHAHHDPSRMRTSRTSP
jgi:hypothetical protein